MKLFFYVHPRAQSSPLCTNGQTPKSNNNKQQKHEKLKTTPKAKQGLKEVHFYLLLFLLPSNKAK